jgi:exopolyphosphatase/guanosine-5'-triphosphate,3'-diphosphate pyrophosphatase
MLSAASEAECTYAGVSVDVEGEPVILYVGDRASTLIASCGDGPVESLRFELGAGGAIDAFTRSDPPTTKERSALYSQTVESLHRARRRFGAGEDGRRQVGIGGPLATLVCTDGRVEYSLYKALHLRRLSATSVSKAVAYLSSTKAEERAELPWVEPWRAQTIVAGAVIVQAVMETLGYDALVFSRRELLDGLVLQSTERW